MQQNLSAGRNALAKESSLYLQQHAGNPVDWLPWSQAVWARAKAEDRLVIVSIGYSTCHWCHVMERESFEDEAVADFMNAHFLAVKVDREERPDVDAAYMTAVQLMTRQGGWPLNVVCLPDGRPVWGGTYFPADRWVASLRAVLQGWRQDRQAFLDYATKLASGVLAASVVTPPAEPADAREHLAWIEGLATDWRGYWDERHGGNTGAPKFPMPPALRWLLRRAAAGDHATAAHLARTLTRIEAGGIHDHLGGGFARYAVDEAWAIPHFEKMLYDNGQLLAIYAGAWLAGIETAPAERALWRRAALRCADWIHREMTLPNWAFAAAMDADSLDEQGMSAEGNFYVWPAEEPAPDGFGWRTNDELPGAVLVRTGAPTERTEGQLADLLERRARRPHPVTDRKVITGWVALAITGLATAHRAWGRPADLQAALTAGTFLTNTMRSPDGQQLHRVFHDAPTGEACLQDWALLASACRALFEQTFDRKWAETGLALVHRLRERFSDPDGMLYMTPPGQAQLFTPQQDLEDGVMPSGASEAAMNFWWYGTLFDQPDLLNHCDKLLAAARERVNWLPSGAQWAEVMAARAGETLEIGIIGGSAEDVSNARQALQRAGWWPQAVWYGAAAASDAVKSPLFAGRFSSQTRIFVCQQGACQLPCATPAEALDQIHSLAPPHT
jgi:uncharacterized protein YyaL (SSP411 family)